MQAIMPDKQNIMEIFKRPKLLITGIINQIFDLIIIWHITEIYNPTAMQIFIIGMIWGLYGMIRSIYWREYTYFVNERSK